jgi:hypothetical protein
MVGIHKRNGVRSNLLDYSGQDEGTGFLIPTKIVLQRKSSTFKSGTIVDSLKSVHGIENLQIHTFYSLFYAVHIKKLNESCKIIQCKFFLYIQMYLIGFIDEKRIN